MNIPRKFNAYFLVASLLLHVIIFLLISFVMNLDNTIHKKIVVLGAHSRTPAQAIYKGKPRSAAGQPGKARGTVRAKRGPRGKAAAQKKDSPKSKRARAKRPARPEEAAGRLEGHPSKQAIPEARDATQKKKKLNLKKIDVKKLKALPPRPSPDEEEEELSPKALKPLEAPLKKEPEPEDEPVEENAETEPTEASEDDEEVIDLGHDYSGNLQMQRLQKLVSIEIERAWQPPVGVKKGTESCAIIRVAKDGSIKSFEFTSKSGIIIYDLSIVKAIESLRFDPSLWGKTITVDFRQ